MLDALACIYLCI